MAGALRFGIAGVTQESNTFAASFSTLADFSIEEGDRVISSSHGTNTEVGGFLEELAVLDVEAVPLLSAWAVSAGPIEDSAFDHLACRLIAQIEKHHFDGLLLALHGSWLNASHLSADAELLRRVRSALGPQVPIVITQDLHANISPPLLAEIQGLVGFRTYPHVDMGETGRRAARLLFEVVTQHLTPRIYLLPIPLLAPPQTATTDRPPIQNVLDRLDRELPSGVTLASSFFCVQPWLDAKGVHSSLVVVTRSESTEVSVIMRDIADELWRHRADFQVAWVAPNELAARLLEEKARPIIVSEAFDGTGGGAPGDHPGMLSLLLPHREKFSACVFLVDSEAARSAHEIGVGGIFDGFLGASTDKRFGPPLKVEARIGHLSDGLFVLKGPVFTGRNVNMGRTAVLEIGRIKIVVASRPVTTVDPEIYRSQQIEPETQDIVAVKSPTLFRPGYASMLRCVLDLDMPGVCQANLVKVPFTSISRPIYPLDDFLWKGLDQQVFCVSYEGASSEARMS